MLGLDAKVLRGAWTILVVLAALGLLYRIRSVLLLMVFSVVFAYVIFPLVTLVERALPGRRRSLAIASVYLVLVAALSTMGALLGPRLGRELAALGARFPEMSAQIQSGKLVGNIFPNWGGAEFLDNLVRSHLPEVLDYAQYALASALAWFGAAWVVVLVPIFAFFFMRDAERIADVVTGLVGDTGRRQLSMHIVGDLHHLLGEYVRALILLCVLTFGVWAAVFRVAGVPYALVLAALGGALEFLPVLGPVVAGILVIAVALFSGFPHPGLLALFILIWRLSQDYVTSPLLMGRGVELHPGLVIFGVLAGGEVGGPAGMFLSIPVLAGLRVVWRRLRDFRADPGTPPRR